MSAPQQPQPPPQPSAHLLAHLSSSQLHPALLHAPAALSRFSWVSGGWPGGLDSAPSSQVGSSWVGGLAPFRPRGGARALYAWSVPAGAGVAGELRRWEAHLSRATLTSAGQPPPEAHMAAAAAAAAGAAGGAATAAAAAAGVSGASSGLAAAAAANAAAHAHPLPSSLPCPVNATGTRWSITIDHCFLARLASAQGGGAGAGGGGGGGGGGSDLSSRVARFSFSPSFGVGSECSWLVTAHSVLSGAGLSAWLESLGGDVLQVKASHVLSGDEWTCGDFVLRLGTLRRGSHVQPLLLLEIEQTACQALGGESAAAMHELALALGVPPAAIPLAASIAESLPKHLASFGLSPSSYSLAHAAVQYINFTNSVREILAQTHHGHTSAAHA